MNNQALDSTIDVINFDIFDIKTIEQFKNSFKMLPQLMPLSIEYFYYLEEESSIKL